MLTSVAGSAPDWGSSIMYLCFDIDVCCVVPPSITLTRAYVSGETKEYSTGAYLHNSLIAAKVCTEVFFHCTSSWWQWYRKLTSTLQPPLRKSTNGCYNADPPPQRNGSALSPFTGHLKFLECFLQIKRLAGFFSKDFQ